MDIIAKRKIYLGFSGTLVFLSLVLVAVFGFQAGIDLKGGTAWQVAFKTPVRIDEIKSLFRSEAGIEVVVNTSSDGSLILRLSDLDEADHQKYLGRLTEEFGELEEKNFSSIGPTIGSELKRKAIWAIVLVMIGISIFITWAFRKVSEPVRSWKYGLITLVTLFHDVTIPAGLLAVLGRLKGIEIDTNFIVALLVVMGFSVHDTIVVFDRIRENLLIFRGKNLPLRDIINKSVSETFVRSVNTSLTLIFMLLTLLFLGPPSLFFFILTILVGTIFGTYSSIFVASPLLYLSQGRGS